KVYGVHLHPIPIPARESATRDPHDNFFLDQEDYVREIGARHGFAYTALRPQLVTGPTPGAWPALAKTLGVQAGPDTRMSLGAYLADLSEVWERIVAKYGPRPLSLRQLVGHGDQHADFAFACGAPEGPRVFVSTIKRRQAGFTKTIDTED